MADRCFQRILIGRRTWSIRRDAPAAARGRGGRGGPTPGGRGAAQGGQTPAAPGRLELLNLMTGEKSSIPNAGSWKFSATSRWIAVRFNRPQPAAARQRHDELPLRRRATAPISFSAISQQARITRSATSISTTSTMPASCSPTRSTPRRSSATACTCSIRRQARRARSTPVAATYDISRGATKGTNLAALRGEKTKDMKQRDNMLLAWTGLGRRRGKTARVRSAQGCVVPEGHGRERVRGAALEPDGSRVFIGIKEQEPEIPAADSIKANVDVWHCKDVVLQSVQIVQIAQARRATYPAVVHLGTGKFVRLGDEVMRTVTNAANNASGRRPRRHAVSRRNRVGSEQGRLLSESTSTPARARRSTRGSRARTALRPTPSGSCISRTSRSSRYNLETGKGGDARRIDDPGKISFVDEDDDHAVREADLGRRRLDDATASRCCSTTSSTSGRRRSTAASRRTSRRASGERSRSSSASRDSARGGGGRGGRGGGGGGAAADRRRRRSLEARDALGVRRADEEVRLLDGARPARRRRRSSGSTRPSAASSKAANADRLIFTEQDFDEFPDYWVTTPRSRRRRR